MSSLSLNTLKEIIEQGDFDALIGHTENEFFECKRAIYLLSDERNKRELAKDVSSFANLNGGYILIGPQTKRNDLHLGDEVETISFLDQSLIVPKEHFDVIKNWVYPDILGLEIFYKPSAPNKDKGIFVIYIPPTRAL